MKMELQYIEISIYLILLVNTASLLLMLYDKKQAERGKWRVRERTFFLWALFFGAAGVLIGIFLFRHKVRDWKFVIGIPVLLGMNVVCLILAVQYILEM